MAQCHPAKLRQYEAEFSMKAYEFRVNYRFLIDLAFVSAYDEFLLQHSSYQ
jgi:hypothetical protein